MARRARQELVVDEREGIIWFEKPRWHAGLDTKEVNLGLMCEAVDMRNIDSGYDDDPYPVVMDCSIMTVPKDMSREYRKSASEGDDYEPDAFDFFGYGGGVPVTDVLEATESAAKSDVRSRVIKQKHAMSGREIEIRRFKDEDDAIQYAKDVYAPNAEAVFGLIGFILDKQVNMMGNTGWDVIGEQATGKSMF